MKQHAIIPIFIPHEGCPHTCVFCNQRSITARQRTPQEEEVRETIETWLSTLEEVPMVEVAFYGGSFTALPHAMQRRYLAIAKEYKDAGRIQKIHLSTRPDAIDDAILQILLEYSVDVVELGVQSFDPAVLATSERGHDAPVIEKSMHLLREHGFETGIQLMIGLPGDSYESCLYSAREAVRLKPDVARLYPTVVLPGTALAEQAASGEYPLLSEEEMIRRTAAMYRILQAAGIRIIRVGLKSNDLIGSNATFHPAFRQLVEGQIAREDIEKQLPQSGQAVVYSNSHSFSNMIGNGGRNRTYFQERFPELVLRYKVDNNLRDGTYAVREGESNE